MTLDALPGARLGPLASAGCVAVATILAIFGALRVSCSSAVLMIANLLGLNHSLTISTVVLSMSRNFISMFVTIEFYSRLLCLASFRN